MAKFKTVEYRRENAEGGSRIGPLGNSTAIVDVTLTLETDDVPLLPGDRQMPKVFGPARYDPMIRRRGSEISITYNMANRPFGLTDPKQVADRAVENFNRVLDEIRQKRQQ